MACYSFETGATRQAAKRDFVGTLFQQTFMTIDGRADGASWTSAEAGSMHLAA
jgi:hypothetical protein